MPPLKNLRHEKFAREMINAPTNKDAYIKAYPDVANNIVASNNASRLLDSVSVKARILELLQQNPATSPDGITKRLNELVASENEGIAMQAVNTGLKVYKMFDEDGGGNTINAIQIVFGNPSDVSDSSKQFENKSSAENGA